MMDRIPEQGEHTEKLTGEEISGSENKIDEKTEEAFYEARRRERHERNMQRRKRRRNTRILSVVVALAVIVGTAGYFLGGDEIAFRIDSGYQKAEKPVEEAGTERENPENAAEVSASAEPEDSEGTAEVSASAEQENPEDATEVSASAEPENPEDAAEVSASAEQEDPEGTAEVSASAEQENPENATEVSASAETENPEDANETTPIPDAAAIEAAAAAQAEQEAAAIEAARVVEVLGQAQMKAIQYDYDGAITLLQSDAAYDTSAEMQQAVAGYQQTKDSCVEWEPSQVTHVFYHSLIVDPSKAFDGDYKQNGYNQMMTTVSEFNKITQSMYEKGYVMVNLYDLAKINKRGVMKSRKIRLPEGKIPFVLSQDDVCYYHSQDGDGFATKLIVDEDGKIRNEYVEDDGSISVGDYDMIPLIDRFVEAHPDFSYHGTKGIIALTGYNGILGYRTDISYQTRPDDLNVDKTEWLDAHPDFNLETERTGAKAVADAMKAEGWTFASHTWGHKNMSDVSMERLKTDTENFKENVDPLIGGTDIIIFAFGADINTGAEYTEEEKFEYLKDQGYNYYCNVDSNQYFVQITDTYFRQGRRNLDGYRMYYNPDQVADLFDAAEVFDKSRPTPVPPMNGSGAGH